MAKNARVRVKDYGKDEKYEMHSVYSESDFVNVGGRTIHAQTYSLKAEMCALRDTGHVLSEMSCFQPEP